MGIIAALIAAASVYIYEQSYDNDIWFILATGREIIENGFPYVNPFTFHEEMGIVVQQWLPDVLAWVVYSAFGFTGLGVLMTVGILILVLLLYRLGRTIRGDSYGGEWILATILLVLPALAAYLSMRPHYYTMIIFAGILNCLEMYRRTEVKAWLGGVLALVLLHANVHMAMAPFDIVIIGCYWLPNFFSLLHKRGIVKDMDLVYGSYPRMPLFVTALIACVLLCVNPYGVSGALYLWLSYGAADYDNYIREMGPLKLNTEWAIDMFVCFILAVFAIVFMTLRSYKCRDVFTFDLPHIVLFVGCSFLAFQHIRNVWLGAFFAFPILVATTAGWWIETPWKSTRVSRAIVAACASAMITIGMVMGIGQGESAVVKPIKDSKNIPQKALSYLLANEPNPEGLRIFNHFTSGGYLEFNGYDALIDPRPELWNSAITGLPEDYYFEYVDFIRGRTPVEDYLEKYDFDYLIADHETKVEEFMKAGTDYEIVVEGKGYNLWKRVR